MPSSSTRLLACLLPLLLGACGEAGSTGGWSGAAAINTNASSIGMWGDHDGWSIIEEVRFGSVEARPKAPGKQRHTGRCASAEARAA